MTSEELERLKRRFGEDFSAWPAPFRQEARALRGLEGNAPDGADDDRLDRLILEAAGMATDEEALKRRVRQRIGRQPGYFFDFVPTMSRWQLSAAAAGLAVALVAAGLLGYVVGATDRDRLDDVMLALATGDAIVGDVGSGPARASDEGISEEDLL